MELLKFRRWLDRRGSTLTIVCPNLQIRRIFEVTGLDRVLTLQPCPRVNLRDLNGGRAVSIGPHAA